MRTQVACIGYSTGPMPIVLGEWQMVATQAGEEVRGHSVAQKGDARPGRVGDEETVRD